MKIRVLIVAAISTWFALVYFDHARAQEPSPERSKQMVINVFGEVGQPGRYLLPGGATALDALAAAGGQGLEADLKQVRLIHKGNGEKPLTDKIDMKAVLAGTQPAPMLHEGDSLSFPRRFIGVQF